MLCACIPRYLAVQRLSYPLSTTVALAYPLETQWVRRTHEVVRVFHEEHEETSYEITLHATYLADILWCHGTR